MLTNRYDRFGATFLAAVVAVTAASLTPSSARAQSAAIELGATPPEDAAPRNKDDVKKAVAALPEIVADIMKRSGVPGIAVAVVHNGETVFAQGFGVREVGKNAPVDANTVFQVASVSKSISATVAAVEVSKGVVSWDDTIVSRLPQFKLSDPYVTAHATIGDFFAHRSGLPPAAGDELEDLGFARKDIIERLAQLDLDAFRSSYHYANFGTTIGAEAVAAASGKPWEELGRQALFEPLGMTSTSYTYADYKRHDNRASLHAFEDGRFQALYDRDPDQQAAAGGISSNVVDLAKWLDLLLGDGKYGGHTLIAPEALLPVLTPQAISARAGSLAARSGAYGYGFNVNVEVGGRTSMGHSGAFLFGAGTAFRIVPSANLGIVVLTNGAPVGAAEGVMGKFLDIALYGAPSRDWYAMYNTLTAHYFEPMGDLTSTSAPANPASGHDLSAYVGRYANTYFGPAEIVAEGDKLRLTLGPKQKSLVAERWDGDTFAVSLSGENAPAGTRSSLKFSFSGEKVKTFDFQFFDDNGKGTWVK